MRNVLLTAVFAIPTVAGADLPEWAGYWAWKPADCVRAGEPGDDTPEYIAPDGIYGVEYSCDIHRWIATGVGKSWRVDMTCMDAGEEIKGPELFVITSEDKLLRIGDDGWVVTLHRCAKGVDE
ncbi:MAG: hypothetical protein AAF393_12965 [Pseudomonadota bacterium]